MADLNNYIGDLNESDAVDTTHLVDIKSYPVKDVLSILLQDKTTKKNIIWATDTYTEYGKNCSDSSHIIQDVFFSGIPIPLYPRIEKATEEQQDRTRSKGEVFTPVWICNRMINWEDQEWFGRPDVFNHENEDGSWTVTEGHIEFPEGRTWIEYVDSRRLEITCGEAPFLVSRYNAATGAFIEPPTNRIGILDRKLRIVNENAEGYEEWSKWAIRAVQSCYGYEWQGDNLLIARINLLMTFYENHLWMWSKDPSAELLRTVANIIAWNIWQMDGSKDVVPFGKPYEEHVQRTLFNMFQPNQEQKGDVALPSKIYDWRRDNSLKFKECKSRSKMNKKLFDFVIGNPPYQEEFSDEGNKTYAAPVYNTFMDAAFKVGDQVELIHPARFLFNAGSTPKAWNQKMLNDPHLKVLHYEEDATEIFPGTEIKGGVVITYHNEEVEYGAIKVFTKNPLLNTILHKVSDSSDFTPLSNVVVTRTAYRMTEKMHEDHPEAINQLSKGHPYDMSTNIFDRLPQIFYDDEPNDGMKYIKILGRTENSRIYKYIRADYVNEPVNLYSYKVFLPKANGNGVFGESLTQPLIINPGVGSTETFLSVGTFSSETEATNCANYIQTKFARAMLGILKTTQDLTPEKWTYVPLQDFTSSSDIDWSKDVSDIDRQLYRKYKLSAEEIEFIETNVQEMK